MSYLFGLFWLSSSVVREIPFFAFVPIPTSNFTWSLCTAQFLSRRYSFRLENLPKRSGLRSRSNFVLRADCLKILKKTTLFSFLTEMITWGSSCGPKCSLCQRAECRRVQTVSNCSFFFAVLLFSQKFCTQKYFSDERQKFCTKTTARRAVVGNMESESAGCGAFVALLDLRKRFVFSRRDQLIAPRRSECSFSTQIGSRLVVAPRDWSWSGQELVNRIRGFGRGGLLCCLRIL